MDDEQHFRRLFAFDVLKKIGVKRPGFLFVGGDRQQSFRLVDYNDVLVLKNDLDVTTRRCLLMTSSGPSFRIQESTCELAAPNARECRCTGLTVKHIADFARQGIWSEWFLNEIRARFQFTLADG